MKNKKIKQVVELAKVYIKEGMTYTDAVKRAEIEVSNMEKEKYEGNGC